MTTNNLPVPAGRTTQARRFFYDNQEFEDPGPQYGARDVLAFLAQTYPELANGSWTKGKQGGAGYATPMAIIILATPHRYIPIYQR